MCVVNLPNLTANSDCAHNTMQLSMCVAWCSFLYSLMLLSFIHSVLHTWWLIASRFWCGQQCAFFCPPPALFDNQKCFPKVGILLWRILISATHKTLELQRQKCSARHSITVVADLILILVLVLVLFINLIAVLSRLVVPTFGSHRSQIHVTWGTRLGPSGHQHQH